MAMSLNEFTRFGKNARDWNYYNNSNNPIPRTTKFLGSTGSKVASGATVICTVFLFVVGVIEYLQPVNRNNNKKKL